MRVSDKTGFVGIGTSAFIHAAFDNIEITDGMLIIILAISFAIITIDITVSYQRYQGDTAG